MARARRHSATAVLLGVIPTSDFVAFSGANGQNPARMRGLRFVRRLLLLALVPAATGRCLVLSDPDFRGQDDCVPFFITHEANPLITARPRIPANVGDPTQFRGSVPLRSCALTRDYTARIFIDGSIVSEVTVPPSGEEVRDVNVLVDVGLVPRGCHFVEVRVSSAFSPSGGDFRRPAREDDLAFLVWTFINDPDATVASCGGGG